MELSAEELNSTPGCLSAAPGLSGWVLPQDALLRALQGADRTIVPCSAVHRTCWHPGCMVVLAASAPCPVKSGLLPWLIWAGTAWE